MGNSPISTFFVRRKPGFSTRGWLIAGPLALPVALGAAMFLPTVGKIAERHPGLNLIVDHMGVPRASKGEVAEGLWSI